MQVFLFLGAILVVFTAVIIARSRSFQVSYFWPLVAFLTPLFVTMIDFRFNILPFFPDTHFYDQLAWDTVLAWQQGDLLPNSFKNFRTQGYALIIAVLYYFAGRMPLVAITLNTAIWGLTVCYWLRLNKEAFNSHSEVLGVLFVIYPSGLIYAASLLREAVVSFFLVITLLHIFRWLQYMRVQNFVIGVISFGALISLRPEAFPIILLSGGFALINIEFDWMSRIKRYGTLLISGGSMIIVFFLFDISGYYNPFRLEFLEIKRRNLSENSFPYLRTLEYESWFDVIQYLPVRTFHFLFQPFPWNPANYYLTFATVDAVFLIIVVPLAVFGVIRYHSKLSAEHMFLVMFAGLSIIGYALVVSSKGAVTRRRLMAMPILLLFVNLALPRIQFMRQSDVRKYKNR